MGLSLSKVATDSVTVGEVITYVITVENRNLANPINNIIVMDILPDSVTYLSSFTNTGTISINGQTITWNIGTLNAGSTVTLTINVRANEPGIVSNTATLTSSSGPQEADASTNVIAAPTRRQRQIICKLPCICQCHVKCNCHEQIKICDKCNEVHECIFCLCNPNNDKERTWDKCYEVHECIFCLFNPNNEEINEKCKHVDCTNKWDPIIKQIEKLDDYFNS